MKKWIVVLALSLAGGVWAEGAWKDLLEGGNLDQWWQKNPSAGWVMEADGSVHLPAGVKGGSLSTRESFQDFELRFEWKISEGGNSGVYYRAAKGKSPEYQILDDEKHVRGQWPVSRAAALYDLFGRSDDSCYKPAGEWNTGKIVAEGKRLQHWLNGVKVVDVEVDSPEWNEAFAKSKFKNPETYGKMNGKIWFQDHGGEVWYRNVLIRSR
ncbi:DUF1080 domain-containing protein [Pontiella sp. NLcol2]|uniref:DUF1080 domain-containing protein n=2 Tax=Pontiella agarivorans TaxID=3038953 RepID=A0ABU5MTR8_9BACT|nr:DUF1080 domain-containing protein [Pontiella agarivorans]